MNKYLILLIALTGCGSGSDKYRQLSDKKAKEIITHIRPDMRQLSYQEQEEIEFYIENKIYESIMESKNE